MRGEQGQVPPHFSKWGDNAPPLFTTFLLEKCSKFDEKSQILKIFVCGGQFQSDICFLDIRWYQTLYDCTTFNLFIAKIAIRDTKLYKIFNIFLGLHITPRLLDNASTKFCCPFQYPRPIYGLVYDNPHQVSLLLHLR